VPELQQVLHDATFAAAHVPMPDAPEAPVRPTTVEPSDLERAMARMKSYIGPAVLVFFLYQIFYLPGLIINLMYLREAKQMEQVAGSELPGTGCLSMMIWAGVLVAALVLWLVWKLLSGGLRYLF